MQGIDALRSLWSTLSPVEEGVVMVVSILYVSLVVRVVLSFLSELIHLPDRVRSAKISEGFDL
jgi:hypothetical protein